MGGLTKPQPCNRSGLVTTVISTLNISLLILKELQPFFLAVTNEPAESCI